MLTTSEMRLPGASAIPAPITSCTVNSPKNSGACRKLFETERSPPIPSAMAYELESGTTTAARSDAPSSPIPKSVGAAEPTAGTSA